MLVDARTLPQGVQEYPLEGKEPESENIELRCKKFGESILDCGKCLFNRYPANASIILIALKIIFDQKKLENLSYNPSTELECILAFSILSMLQQSYKNYLLNLQLPPRLQNIHEIHLREAEPEPQNIESRCKKIWQSLLAFRKELYDKFPADIGVLIPCLGMLVKGKIYENPSYNQSAFITIIAFSTASMLQQVIKNWMLYETKRMQQSSNAQGLRV